MTSELQNIGEYVQGKHNMKELWERVEFYMLCHFEAAGSELATASRSSKVSSSSTLLRLIFAASSSAWRCEDWNWLQKDSKVEIRTWSNSLIVV